MTMAKLGNNYYVLPFRSNGLWVEDSRGYSVCEEEEFTPDERDELDKWVFD